MKTNRKVHPTLVIGGVLFGLCLMRGCSNEAGSTDTSDPAPSFSADGPGYPAPQAVDAGGDGSYIHRTESGITVGGNGRDWYVSDGRSGGSVANDGN
jgi:hypothetical protein